MNASTKTMLMQCLRLLSLTILPIILCSLTKYPIHAFLFMGGFVVVYVILLYLPVSCSTGFCTGRMRQSVTRISFWEERWSYQCDTCGDVFETEIFAPNISVEVSS